MRRERDRLNVLVVLFWKGENKGLSRESSYSKRNADMDAGSLG